MHEAAEATRPSPSESVDIAQILDAASWRGPTLMVSLLTILALVFDGFDIQAIAFAAPSLMQEWGIDRSALAPILAAGLIGMALGGFLLGSFGDHHGRRRGLLLSLSLIAASSAGAACSDSPLELSVWRLLTGIGLGGALPNAMALMAEFAPRRWRHLLVAITVIGVPVGGLIGAELAAQLIPAFGWRAIFVAGAVLPALLTVAMFGLLPESPRFLARDPARHARLAALLNRIGNGAPCNAASVFVTHESVHPVGVRTLFSREFRRDTLIIWLIFFSNIFSVYAFFGWLPTVLSSAGLPLTTALRGALVFNLGGVVGALLIAWLIGRHGSRRVLLGAALAAVGSTAGMGFLAVGGAPEAHGVGALLALMAVAGATILGIQTCSYVITAHAYPTACRSAGLGWAVGIARFGGILSSYSGSALLALGGGMRPFFVGIALVVCVTAAGIALLGRHVPPERN